MNARVRPFPALCRLLSSALFILFLPAAVLPQPYPAVGFNGGTYNGAGVITVLWTGNIAVYTSYNIRWQQGTVLTSAAYQANRVSMGVDNSYKAFKSDPGPYTFIVQGCYDAGLWPSGHDCSPWSSQLTVTIPTGPPPGSFVISWPPMSAGDCRMQNAKLNVMTNGKAIFTAQVMTTHTTSGDYWHADLKGLDKNKNAIEDFGSIVSMKLAQGHSWYDWNFTFQYDGTHFPQITAGDMQKSC